VIEGQLVRLGRRDLLVSTDEREIRVLQAKKVPLVIPGRKGRKDLLATRAVLEQMEKQGSLVTRVPWGPRDLQAVQALPESPAPQETVDLPGLVDLPDLPEAPDLKELPEVPGTAVLPGPQGPPEATDTPDLQARLEQGQRALLAQRETTEEPVIPETLEPTV